MKFELSEITNRKIVALVFVLISLGLGVVFYSKIELPDDLGGYFKSSYYSQFGPLAIAIELLIAGFFLFTGHKKSNFTLALFGFTAILDPIFNLTGILTSVVPSYATILFIICAIIALWIAFTNTFNLGKISLAGATLSFIMGTALELFFYYI